MKILRDEMTSLDSEAKLGESNYGTPLFFFFCDVGNGVDGVKNIKKKKEKM